ncbi:RidA family protein [Roseomonas sp. HJA6]|uniref:RidA family protein n=1 Tax=Roseomonas alba TaxID=2846776 RepID=A0ABS7A7Y5_9PROT|nr:RidA family protein [Neoroseomonas alba]MBW6398220.1 RidA family protein [Neoroseomonas alba]
MRHHIFAGFPPSVSPSSHAVEADGFVFLTGQFPRDLDDPDAPFPDGIAAQTTRTMSNLARALGALGLGLEHVVSVRVYLTEFRRDYAAMNAAYAAALPPGGRPVRTCIGVTALVRDALIEIEAVAKRP